MKKSSIPIVDLHCDLLAYLSHKPGRTTKEPIARCSHPQLMKGNVKVQTLAIYSPTDHRSLERGRAQIDHFQKLLEEQPLSFASCTFPLNPDPALVHILPAFENASAFAGESEPLGDVLKRLEEYREKLGPIFYISLTWDMENRFGGGNRTFTGLKSDGKHLLEWMSGKRVALDLSHTSDRLAYDMLDYIISRDLAIPVMASHSNFRAISDYPRNLCDEIAKEIIRRGGLIGMNFFAPFIHKSDPSALVRHIEYGLVLGGEKALCFGADFFCDADSTYILEKYQTSTAFFPELSDAASYPALLARLADTLKLSEEVLTNIASQNALRFLKERIL